MTGMIHEIKIITLFLAVSISLMACQKEPVKTEPIGFDAYMYSSAVSVKSGATKQLVNPVLLEGGSGEEPLYYGVVETDMDVNLPTKGAPYSAASGFPTTSNFGLCAYIYDDEDDPVSSKTLYTAGLSPWRTVSYNDVSARWLPSGGLDWPLTSRYMDFYAFAPLDNVSSVSASDGNLPAFSYTVPSAIEDQHGLLVASSTGRSANPQMREYSVPLGFHHVLSGVRFMVASTLLINSITVSGVYDQGAYDMEDASWSGRDKSVTTPSYRIDSPSTTVVEGFRYVDADNILMMIPQTLPSGATITIWIAGEETARVLNVNGQQWRAGKLVTYIIAKEGRFALLGDTEGYPEDDGSDW